MKVLCKLQYDEAAIHHRIKFSGSPLYDYSIPKTVFSRGEGEKNWTTVIA